MLYDLYVVSNDHNSKKALRLRTKECNVCDIRQMEQIPTFLKGVPSLYIRKSKLVMTGTQALQFLSSLQAVEVAASSLKAASEDVQFTTKSKSNFVSQAPSRDYTDDKKIGESELQRLIAERNSQFSKNLNDTPNPTDNPIKG
jgi:hypothetical protein